MSDIDTPQPSRRPRRAFTPEYETGAVRLVLDEGQSIHAVAQQLDLSQTALGEWVKRASADRTHGRTGLTESFEFGRWLPWCRHHWDVRRTIASFGAFRRLLARYECSPPLLLAFFRYAVARIARRRL